MSISPRTLTVVALVAVVSVVLVVANKNARRQDGAPAITSPAQSSNAAAPAKKLLFFMNPNGYPCQTQLGILNGISGSIARVAQVVYYKTTEPADMQKFEEYGIRALPTLIVADEHGRALVRLPAGVQSGETVLASLAK